MTREEVARFLATIGADPTREAREARERGEAGAAEQQRAAALELGLMPD